MPGELNPPRAQFQKLDIMFVSPQARPRCPRSDITIGSCHDDKNITERTWALFPPSFLFSVHITPAGGAHMTTQGMGMQQHS